MINYADGKMINFNHLIINLLFVNWINFLAYCVININQDKKSNFRAKSPSDLWWPDPSNTRAMAAHCYLRGVKKKIKSKLDLISSEKYEFIHNSFEVAHKPVKLFMNLM